MPFRAEERLAVALALYAGGCAAASFFLVEPSAWVASAVILPLSISWLVLALGGPRNA